jgi:hypothetical protein
MGIMQFGGCSSRIMDSWHCVVAPKFINFPKNLSAGGIAWGLAGSALVMRAMLPVGSLI